MKWFVFLVTLIFAGSITAVGNASMPQKEETNVKPGVVKAWRLGDTNYCHLKFPPITLPTLFSSKPKLADAKHVGLLDYYGPCNHDPLGEVEVQRQQDRWEQRFASH
jgi:hypothetical protein